MTTPEIIHSPHAMREWSLRRCRAGQKIAAVPTMGALHAGHEVLIEEGKRQGDVVVVTIFVNPLQFDRSEDFDSYPRPESEDIEICARLGVDAIYFPTAAEMYPAGFDTRVEPGTLAESYEGAHRPGHFAGVATVVTKLLLAVRPDVAIFGEKDAQQLAVINQMVTDLDLGVEICAVPTVREPDGLALSSRNRRLSTAAREAAVCVPEALRVAEDGLTQGDRPWSQIQADAQAVIDSEPLATLEYLDLVDPQTFRPLADHEAIDEGLLVIAAWVDGVRLIDNRRISVSQI
jgi:pantoate--beta-alanine ligase